MQMVSNSENRVYAGFFVRLAAFLLDMLIVNVLLTVIKVPVWFVQLAVGDVFLFKPLLFSYNVFDILYYLLTVAYFILATYFSGNTLGKYLMKIKVVSTDGQKMNFMSVLIRETVGRYLSALIIYIGYMMAGWDTKKQGLHDRIADTYVIYRSVTGEKVQPVVNQDATVQFFSNNTEGEN